MQTSPLRYPGSKIKLVNHLRKILEFNKFKPRILVEPFVGGGSVFLNFLDKSPAEKIIIGDKDILVFSFWKTVFANPQHLIRFIKNVDVSIKAFKKYKIIANNPSKQSKKKLAEACLFLNRTSFSGIIANGAGPIGGAKQKSKYKVDCRFNREELINKIEFISKFKSRVTVLNADWSQTIKYARKKYQDEDIFVYLDPPFYYKAERLYREYFDHVGHTSLNSFLKKLECRWILSYDRAKEIKSLYKDFFGHKNFSFAYSINSPAKRIEKELLITSKNLKIPTKSFLTK